MIFIKKIINFFIFIFIKIKFFQLPKKSLRILMFHNIDNFEKFYHQLLILKKEWNFINPNDFYKIASGKKKIDKRYILLTFDDGFKSNLTVAEKYLKKFGTNAFFFIPLKFLLLKIDKEKKDFIKKNLELKKISPNMNNLNMVDIKKIINLNNIIGAHTYSHINLKKIKNKKKIHFEIIGSANKLEKILKTKIFNFSFNFGRLKHISPIMLRLSKKRFKYIFTGIRGDNINSKKIFFRDNISPEDNIFDIYSYLGGFFDFLYRKERVLIKNNFKKKLALDSYFKKPIKVWINLISKHT
tara:strand:+ start:62 stop:955 length:894 start_codon:yes stop_codon:yes gene_type:complete